VGKKTELLGTQADDEFLLEAEFPYDKGATKVDGYTLIYNSATGKYEPAPVAALAFLLTSEGGIIYDSNGEVVLKG
jgi:hypothetical protein